MSFRCKHAIQVKDQLKVKTNSKDFETFIDLFNRKSFSSKDFWVWGAFGLNARVLGSWSTGLGLQKMHEHLSKKFVVS